VFVVVPAGIDDPQRPSGGNVYDRRMCRGLAALGWSVHELAVPGSWSSPDPAAGAVLTGVIAGIPDGSVALVDGLIASAVPQVLVPEARRLRLVVLLHMPAGEGPAATREDATRERAVLSAAAAVITTSSWTRRRIVDRYAVPPGHVRVAEPGVDAADLAPGTGSGGEFLCVAAVAPHKGHDVLLAALRMLADIRWSCVFVGSLDRDPGFVEQLRRRIPEYGLQDQVRFAGALIGVDLDAAYAAADVLVLASHSETYGMVVTEALARGIPVVATDVGGLPEALGYAPDGRRPGMLVRAGDPATLSATLRRWLDDPDLQHRLRRAALHRRDRLPGWSVTADRISHILAGVMAGD
jgi:glycosyltransferase involved in cell wall biosynthesis